MYYQPPDFINVNHASNQSSVSIGATIQNLDTKAWSFPSGSIQGALSHVKCQKLALSMTPLE